MHRIAASLFVTLLLTGCSSNSDGKPTSNDETPTPSSSTPTADGPQCKDIWKVGAKLSADYTTCLNGSAIGTQEVTKCKDGKQLVAFDDTYYAITGGEISKPDTAPMQDTEEFGKAYSACTGE